MNGTLSDDRNPGFVELQLLRHGPPHNQLLSPLTEYLALCGDHSNTTLRIPLEHAALLTRLRALRYLDSEQTRVDQLRETARIASDLLANVPGLIADLSSDRAGGRPFVHLSIASRASELALFPFELAVAPDGFPGAGQPICLQQQLPICLTRRSKNVRNVDFPWDRPIKILMVASNAGGTIPVQQHYALLRKLVEPWVGTGPFDDSRSKVGKRRPILRLLTKATVRSIEKTLCDEVHDYGQPFTHLHVLAHGCDLPGTDQRFGVALHHPDRPDEIDAVEGQRLAKALGCLPGYPSTAKRFQGPAVVTLATCDSAGHGGIIKPGASLAFELHDSGVPLVIGSQFPLSAEGSIILTESMYRGFLAGRDPRSVIWEARRALRSNMPQRPTSDEQEDRTPHDWASLTVYAALPDRINQILPIHRRNRQRARMDVRLQNLHRLLKFDESGRLPNPKQFQQADVPGSFGKTLLEADRAVRKFNAWVDDHDADELEARVVNEGILASAQKQVGLLYLRASIWKHDFDKLTDAEAIARTEAGEYWLRTSAQTYRHIFELSRDASWAVVQFLVLDFSLRGRVGENERDLWNLAKQLALLDQHSQDVDKRVWALAMLLELQFLRWLENALSDQGGTDDIDVDDLIRRLRDLFRDAPIEVYSAKRQFDRYVTDFAILAQSSQDASDSNNFAGRRKSRQDTSAGVNSRVQSAIDRIKTTIRDLNDLDFSQFEHEEESAIEKS